MSFNITNVQGIVSKAALAGQMQDAANRGHELASEHASQNMKEEHGVNLEKVTETNKPEESMDREANPEEQQEQEGQENAEEQNQEQNQEENEKCDDEAPGHPDADGHIDFTV